MEELILIGKLESGKKKDSQDFWYRINYLNLNTGIACQDYFDNVQDFKSFVDLNIPVGSKCIGLFKPNSRRMMVCYSAKICK